MAARSNDGGILATVLGLTVLVFVGFGLGLVVGGLWEEPDLIVRHLIDGTGEAVVGILSPAAKPGDVARLQPAAERSMPQKSNPPPAVSTAPPSGSDRIAVQVGAFSDSEAAQNLAELLRSKGYDVYLSPGAVSGDARWRVRVGPLKSPEQARRIADELKTEEKLPTWVLTENQGA